METDLGWSQGISGTNGWGGHLFWQNIRRPILIISYRMTFCDDVYMTDWYLYNVLFMVITSNFIYRLYNNGV